MIPNVSNCTAIFVVPDFSRETAVHSHPKPVLLSLALNGSRAYTEEPF